MPAAAKRAGFVVVLLFLFSSCLWLLHAGLPQLSADEAAPLRSLKAAARAATAANATASSRPTQQHQQHQQPTSVHPPTPVSSEGLQLTAAYSQSLSALSSALTQARQRAEEATALKQQLDQLRHSQQQHQQQQQQQPALLLQQQQHPPPPSNNNHSTTIITARPPSYPPTPAHAPGWTDPHQQQHQQQQQQQQQHQQQQQQQHNRIRVFIGVYTGVNLAPLNASEQQRNYTMRRAMLRATWFPGSQQERRRLESEHGIVLRFVVGSVADPQQAAALAAEERQYGDILRLPLPEGYSSLPNKTRTFFKVVTDAWQADWVVKMDDDVFLNPLRLLAASQQWDKMGAGYVGCMKHGYPWRQRGTRWYEPNHLLVGHTYWLHAYGSIYAVAGPVAKSVIAANWSQLRLLANEDTSVGLWLLAADVRHFEDMRLCSPRCTPASVGVLRNECAGLCDPLVELPQLHASSNCSAPPQAGQLLRYHASHPEHKAFEAMWVA